MTSQTSNSTRMTPARIAISAAFVLASSLGIANAAPPADNVRSAVVSYGDLNIRSAEGAQALYRRIAAAARQVCPLPDPRDLVRAGSVHACREAAIARAVRDINNPPLAALQAGPHG